MQGTLDFLNSIERYWFEHQLDIFQNAVELFITGNKNQHLKELSQIRNDELKE